MMTVAELIHKLSQVDGELPVYVGTGYDNDSALTGDVHAYLGTVYHIEGEFYESVDAQEFADYDLIEAFVIE